MLFDQEWLKKWEMQLQVGLLLAAGVFAFLFFGLWSINWSPEVPVCAPTEYIKDCFQMPQKICFSAEERIRSECKQILSGLELPPGRLISPILKNCMDLRFDKNFPSMRRSQEKCRERKQALDDWKRSNPDF